MKKTTRRLPLYDRIRQILESARSGISRTVNTTQVVANWLIGQEIVEEEQQGKAKADYGKPLLEELSGYLKREYGDGFSVDNLEMFRRFYLEYASPISDAVRRKLAARFGLDEIETPNAPCTLAFAGSEKGLRRPKGHAVRNESLPAIFQAPVPKSWHPGLLHSNLSWTHYRTLLRVEKREARSFYEIEAIQNNWAARELERQVNSLLYERLALSRDKKGLMRLANKGQEIQGPLDVFKYPMVLEFLKIPASTRLVETKLEEALLNDLQAFLMELGKGFAFVARQERITIDGDHFYATPCNCMGGAGSPEDCLKLAQGRALVVAGVGDDGHAPAGTGS